MVKASAGQLRHTLSSEDLELDLKLRPYISGAVCSILTEAWLLNEETSRVLNGANAYTGMLSHITDNNHKYEASADTTTFNLLQWIRARRHRWLGHILRLPDERLIKQAVRHIHEF